MRHVREAHGLGALLPVDALWPSLTAPPLEDEGQRALNSGRQPDGSWLFAIDNPYGTEHGFG